jgi:hypothetical protein
MNRDPFLQKLNGNPFMMAVIDKNRLPKIPRRPKAIRLIVALTPLVA